MYVRLRFQRLVSMPYMNLTQDPAYNWSINNFCLPIRKPQTSPKALRRGLLQRLLSCVKSFLRPINFSLRLFFLREATRCFWWMGFWRKTLFCENYTYCFALSKIPGLSPFWCEGWNRYSFISNWSWAHQKKSTFVTAQLVSTWYFLARYFWHWFDIIGKLKQQNQNVACCK